MTIYDVCATIIFALMDMLFFAYTLMEAHTTFPKALYQRNHLRKLQGGISNEKNVYVFTTAYASSHFSSL